MVCEYPVGHLNYRADLVVHDREGKPLLLADFKAPTVPIDNNVVEQIRRYNAVVMATYLLAGNGTVTLFWKLNQNSGRYEPLDNIPSYEELLKQHRP